MTAELTLIAETGSVPAPRQKLAGDRIPVLDGLRGIAILLVMYHHFGTVGTSGTGAALVARTSEIGWIGVDLFFVLSGFLITGILLDTRSSANYFRSFYARRVLRIFPLYYFFLCVVLFIFAPLGGAHELTERQLPLWTYLTNFDMVRHSPFTGRANVVVHLWSLAVEEQFYLLWPLLVFWIDRRWLTWLALGGLLASPLVRVWLGATGHPAFFAYLATPSRLDSLATGALIAIAVRSVGGLAALRRFAPAALAGATIVLCATYTRVPHFNSGSWTVMYWALPALALGFGAVLVFALTAAPLSRLSRLLSSEKLRFFGRYSYGMYVWHPFVSRLLLDAGLTQERLGQVLAPGGAATLAAVLVKGAATTGVALLSWHLLESPFLRLKDRVKAIPAPASDARLTKYA